MLVLASARYETIIENCPQNIRDNILTPFTSKIIDLSQEPYDPDLLIKKGYDGIKLFIGTDRVPPSNQYGIIPHPDDVHINDSGIILYVGNLKYVPIFDYHLPNIDTCHIAFLEKGMHKKAKDFLYTKKLSSSKPFYEAQIKPD